MIQTSEQRTFPFKVKAQRKKEGKRKRKWNTSVVICVSTVEGTPVQSKYYTPGYRSLQQFDEIARKAIRKRQK